MYRRSLLAGAAALAAAPALAQGAGARTRVVFWHAMNAPLGDEVNKLVAEFNAARTRRRSFPSSRAAIRRR